ncbi:hypothetical protein DICPUDRAFT_91545, partial [Dictyostelium purpureum]
MKNNLPQYLIFKIIEFLYVDFELFKIEFKKDSHFSKSEKKELIKKINYNNFLNKLIVSKKWYNYIKNNCSKSFEIKIHDIIQNYQFTSFSIYQFKNINKLHLNFSNFNSLKYKDQKLDKIYNFIVQFENLEIIYIEWYPPIYTHLRILLKKLNSLNSNLKIDLKTEGDTDHLHNINNGD